VQSETGQIVGAGSGLKLGTDDQSRGPNDEEELPLDAFGPTVTILFSGICGFTEVNGDEDSYRIRQHYHGIVTELLQTSAATSSRPRLTAAWCHSTQRGQLNG
jgi:hypothetical protein